MKNPYCSKKYWTPRHWCGKTANSSFDPSSGGIGTRLKIASTRLSRVMAAAMPTKLNVNSDAYPCAKLGINLTAKPKTMASKIFAAGPAAPTIAGPHF